MKAILLLIALIYSTSTFALFGFFEDNNKKQEVDPIKLKTEHERIEWLKVHDKEFADQLLKKQKKEKLKVLKTGDDRDFLWEKYEKESEHLYDPNREEREKQKRIVEMKKLMKKKALEQEERIKKGYRFVNGKLIDPGEIERLKKEKEKKKLEMERVIKFYKEMKIPVPKDINKIKVKDY